MVWYKATRDKGNTSCWMPKMRTGLSRSSELYAVGSDNALLLSCIDLGVAMGPKKSPVVSFSCHYGQVIVNPMWQFQIS